MNPDNLRSLADLPPERRREIARMGGKASGIERARRAYMKQSAREIILKMHYFYEAEEERVSTLAQAEKEAQHFTQVNNL